MNTIALEQQVRQLLADNPRLGRKHIARRLGVKPNGTLRRIVERLKANLPIDRKINPLPDADPAETRDFKENDAVISTRRKNVRTLDELLKYMNVDLSVWEVERHVINKWEVGGKPGESNSLRANSASGFAVEPLYQVKAWLKRKQPAVREVSFENLLTRIGTIAPKKWRTLPKPDAGKFLLEISLFDAHFGLLAWGKETGEDYDLRIAERRYLAAVEDLLGKTRGCLPERIVFPFGNDFLHVNNPEGVTPASHNVLDVDGRLCKVLETAELATIRAIELCAQVAPVTILWIPGNHDPETSFYICRVLRAYFRTNRRVTVDTGPAQRKYLHYGNNLIGYTHGNEERHADLPTIMAGENRCVWGKVKFCEWHVGHYHKEKETRYTAGDTYGGVVVRTLPSLAGTDAWHFKKGYVNGRRIADATLYDFELGPVANYKSRDMRNPEEKAS